MSLWIVYSLQQIINKEGDSILSSSKRLSACFRLWDLYHDSRYDPKDKLSESVFELERKAFLKCLDYGFLKKLIKVAYTSDCIVIKRKLAQKLHKKVGLELDLCVEMLDLLEKVGVKKEAAIEITPEPPKKWPLSAALEKASSDIITKLATRSPGMGKERFDNAKPVQPVTKKQTDLPIVEKEELPMDLDKLRKISQDARNDLEGEILQHCDPQQIAMELMDELQVKATEAAEKGVHKAKVDFKIWQEYLVKNLPFYTYTEGPLYDFSDKYKATELLLNMVRKYVTDKNIQLYLTENDWHEGPEYNIGQWITASVEW
jgi:hypothetical protein